MLSVTLSTVEETTSEPPLFVVTHHMDSFSRFQLTSTLFDSRPAMSNPNGLLRQKLCHCLGKSRTLNDILLRAAH